MSDKEKSIESNSNVDTGKLSEIKSILLAALALAMHGHVTISFMRDIQR